MCQTGLKLVFAKVSCSLFSLYFFQPKHCLQKENLWIIVSWCSYSYCIIFKIFCQLLKVVLKEYISEICKCSLQILLKHKVWQINSLQLGVAYLYPLKTRFSDVFRGYRKVSLGCNGLMCMFAYFMRTFILSKSGYCAVAIMKNFIQLISHFNWLRSLWRGADIFW